MPEFPKDPDGVLSGHARAIYRTVGFFAALVGGGAVLGWLLAGLVVNAGAEAKQPAPVNAVEHKLDKIDERVRELQVDVSAIKARLDTRERDRSHR